MPYGELYIPQERATHNALNGQFLKGHTPHNKGKKWSEFLSKRSQKRCAKGWENLVKHRPQQRPETAGRCKKKIIAVDDNGKWYMFPYSLLAAKWCGGLRENVNRCCKENQKRHINKKTKKINTDHKYMGVRFYFESDDVWMEKINNT